jgi:site-specific recombinase XerD
MKDFLEWSETEYAAKPNTHKRYQTSSKALLAYFGESVIDSITTDDVERFKVQRARQKKLPQGIKSKKKSKATKQLKPATVNRELACLKHLFKRNEDLIGKNPVKGVKSFAAKMCTSRKDTCLTLMGRLRQLGARSH